MHDYLKVKREYLDGLRKDQATKIAGELKAKYRPKPPPKAETTDSAPPKDADVDLASLDEATIQALLGD